MRLGRGQRAAPLGGGAGEERRQPRPRVLGRRRPRPRSAGRARAGAPPAPGPSRSGARPRRPRRPACRSWRRPGRGAPRGPRGRVAPPIQQASSGLPPIWPCSTRRRERLGRRAGRGEGRRAVHRQDDVDARVGRQRLDRREVALRRSRRARCRRGRRRLQPGGSAASRRARVAGRELGERARALQRAGRRRARRRRCCWSRSRAAPAASGGSAPPSRRRRRARRGRRPGGCRRGRAPRRRPRRGRRARPCRPRRVRPGFSAITGFSRAAARAAESSLRAFGIASR